MLELYLQKKIMAAILSSDNYGKSEVRVLKVSRSGQVHSVSEYTVNIQLRGDFEEVHTKGNNSKVLPTDTMKNTVYALAKQTDFKSPEEFGLALAGYLLKNNPQVSSAEVIISEKLWNRIPLTDKSGKEILHDHSFISAGNEKRTAHIMMTRSGTDLSSGITDLLVLKTTDSGFENYIKDKYTTLKETSDRIFSTSVRAVWKYANQEVNYVVSCRNVREIIIRTFANHKSLSVQQTLFECGKNVTDELPEISEIFLSMPNKHYLLFNLEQFGMKNENEIFIPTSEPYGLIEATIKRK